MTSVKIPGTIVYLITGAVAIPTGEPTRYGLPTPPAYFTAYKIGITKDATDRPRKYNTHSKSVQPLQALRTIRRKKHALERTMQAELQRLGFHRIGLKSEWFMPPENPTPEAQAFLQYGFIALKACRGRKVYILNQEWQAVDSVAVPQGSHHRRAVRGVATVGPK